jgi:hypothetical protein
MKPTTPEPKRAVDVTGLPEEAVRAVESLVANLRAQKENSLSAFASYEEWSKAFREWGDSHPPVSNPADWSRESIYAGRGE